MRRLLCTVVVFYFLRTVTNLTLLHCLLLRNHYKTWSGISPTFYSLKSTVKHQIPWITTSLCSSSFCDDHFVVQSVQHNQSVHNYINYVQSFVESDELVLFTIKGPSKTSFRSSSEARGNLRMITGRPIVLSSKVVIQVTFKYHGATDICKNWNLHDCHDNLVAILLSTTQWQNVVPHSEWGVPPQFSHLINASAETSNGTKLELKIDRGTCSLQIKAATSNSSKSQIRNQQHDRNKFSFVDLSNPIWQALGVKSTTSDTVRPGMASKLRQCQKFVEIVERLIRENIDNETSDSVKKSNISVVDMGCGRGYLTFSLHAYLHTHHKLQVASRGIDVRPKLIKEISDIASNAGREFEGLRFEVGTIDSFLSEVRSDENKRNHIEVVIALHACDTATDDALWSGISRESDVIVVAPCCHQQLRPQLNQYLGTGNGRDHPYAEILRHNVYRERLAETVTDSMRALLLESMGYKVQVFEFIGGEHTSKNVMITAIRKGKNNTSSVTNRKLKSLHSVAMLHGIKQQKLSSWMGISFTELEAPSTNVVNVKKRKMPPLE